CGAGIDCFIAAKHVGPSGKVIGIDMTDRMLEVAAQAKPQVAAKLGYDVVEFRNGYLEQVPVEDKSVDVVISNCVINLSPDKRAVFREMWRMLKDHGRMCVADIVSERPVPAHLKVNPQLWGECTVGALTEEEFLAYAEQAGFYGVEILKKAFYKTIEGYHFYSVTVRGYKFEKKASCRYVGQTAIYHGPFKAVMDEEGHLFPRDVAIEVCTDTAAKLSAPPYQALFTVTQPTQQIVGMPAAAPNCGPGCC
ncbi:MAG: methyltransferase domain-containing protein, partial [Candidatus Omnitrophica bacterium]|nr:methyltransferase domain-containing protein [Candidatus Omnitrophota bacterium]